LTIDQSYYTKGDFLSRASQFQSRTSQWPDETMLTPGGIGEQGGLSESMA